MPSPPLPSNASEPLPRLGLRFMFSHPAHIISLGFGSGLFPFIPGTIGTLVGWLSFLLLNPYLNPLSWVVIIALGFIAGIYSTAYTAKKLGVKDPGAANWDEVVAFWLVMLFIMPASLWSQALAFVVFRFFDMVKPPPINYFDKHVQGGFGIMFDDIVAAFFTLLVFALFRFFMG